MKNAKWMIVSVATVLAACAGTPSHQQAARDQTMKAPQQTVAANRNESDNTDDPDRVVCTYKKKLGSHFPQKQCMTVRQMKKRQAESRRTVQNAQHRGGSGGGG